MATDLTTRILVTGILLCVLLLVVQRLGPAGHGPEPEEVSEKGRYQLVQLRTKEGSSVLLRSDTATGRLWYNEDLLEDGRWIALSEPPPEEEWGAFDESAAGEAQESGRGPSDGAEERGRSRGRRGASVGGGLGGRRSRKEEPKEGDGPCFGPFDDRRVSDAASGGAGPAAGCADAVLARRRSRRSAQRASRRSDGAVKGQRPGPEPSPPQEASWLLDTGSLSQASPGIIRPERDRC